MCVMCAARRAGKTLPCKVDAEASPSSFVPADEFKDPRVGSDWMTTSAEIEAVSCGIRGRISSRIDAPSGSVRVSKIRVKDPDFGVTKLDLKVRAAWDGRPVRGSRCHGLDAKHLARRDSTARMIRPPDHAIRVSLVLEIPLHGLRRAVENGPFGERTEQLEIFGMSPGERARRTRGAARARGASPVGRRRPRPARKSSRRHPRRRPSPA